MRRLKAEAVAIRQRERQATAKEFCAITDDPSAPPQKGKRPRRTPEQELAYLAERIAKIKSAEQLRSRKAETREKIVIGGAIVKAMRDDPEWRLRVVPFLETAVTRAVDREAIASWLSAT